MAVYVPAGARHRRLVLSVIAALIVGLAVGVVTGRATSPGLADEVADVQELAVDAATAFERIPIEYEQLLAGGEGESTDTVQDAIDAAEDQLKATYSEAIWLGSDAASETDAAVDELTTVFRDGGSAQDFAAAVDGVVAAIEERFAVRSDQA